MENATGEGPSAGRPSSSAEVSKRKTNKPVFKQNGRMPEIQLFPRNGRVISLAFKLRGTKPDLFELITILG